MKRSVTGAVAVALLWGLGCGPTPCEKRRAVEERDTCWFEQVQEHVGAGEVDDAVALVQRIESPLIRFAAIQRLASQRSGGIGYETIAALCGELSGDMGEKCLGSWKRPHLWE